MVNAKWIISKLVILYFVLFPFGQLGRFEFYSYTFHLADIVVGFVSLVYLLFNYSEFRQRLSKGSLEHSLLGFVAIAFFTLLVNFSFVLPQEALRGFLYLLRLISYILLYFAISHLLKTKFLTGSNLLEKLKHMGFLVASFALFQYLFLPDTRVLKNFGWDDHYFRSIGTFLDPNFLGLILVLLTLLMFSQEWRREDLKQRLPLFLLSLTTLALTFSRSSVLALVAGLFVINIVRRKTLITLVALLYIIVSLYLLPKPSGESVNLTRSSTINSRVVNFKDSIRVGLENPLFGKGFNLLNWQKIGAKIDNSHSQFGADSSLLFAFLTTGVLGLSAFLYLLYKILKVGWVFKKSTEGLLFLSSVLAILVHSIFQNSFFYPWVLGWLMILLAAVVSRNLGDQVS